MCKLNIKTQSGFALLIFIVVMMGVGGIIVAGYTQGILKQVEESKFQHNQRVLREAKQALLQYAYNYPNFNSEGPGRLPCPYDLVNGYSGTISGLICNAVGRLPWNSVNLNFYDARDSSDERLWYAVSNQFYNLNGGPVINSGSWGSITLTDQSGAQIYAGNDTIPRGGIAAVIIAPGAAINGQNRDGGANQVDPYNYLDRDSINGFDNSFFINGESDDPDDGFILGPVFDPAQNFNVINDQFIIITAAEVIEMAEKATLEVYRNAILAYLAPLAQGGTAGVYPWLYNYADVIDFPGLKGFYPALANFGGGGGELNNNLGNFGRIPSMFGPYFSEINTERIQSKISLDFNGADFLGTITYNQDTPVVATGSWVFSNILWNGDPTIDGPATLNLSIETAETVTELRFEDNATPGIVDLIGTIAADESFSFIQPVIWFHRKESSGDWAKCKSVHLVDCHVNTGFDPDPHGPGQQSIEILRVEIADYLFDSSASDLVKFTFDVSNLTGPPGPLVNLFIAAASGTGHAQITADFASSDFSPPIVTGISYEYDSDYTDADWNVEASGTLSFSSFSSATVNLGLRYYPELPDWAFDNDWQNSMMMAYADDYRPDNNAAAGNCVLNVPCLQIKGLAGNNNFISLLALASENNWVDGDDDPFVGLDGLLTNDIGDVFNLENSNLDNVFDIRTVENTGAPGDTQRDKILVIN